MRTQRPARSNRSERSVVATIVGASLALSLVTVAVSTAVGPATPVHADEGRVGAGRVVRVAVPEALGGKTMLGQLTVDNATGPGFVTAYGCGDGLPHDDGGAIARSDVNFDGRISKVSSNRLIVQADSDGDVCFYTSARVDLVIDVNAVSFDVGINSFANRRTDTRAADLRPRVAAESELRVRVPEAIGGRAVVGQLTVDRAEGAGFVSAYACDHGLPTDHDGRPLKSDLNYDAEVSPVASNRLVVQADDDGHVCFTPSTRVDLVVDLNAVTDVGIRSFPNRRTDTRRGSGPTAVPQIDADGVLQLHVPRAVGAGTVIGQLTVDRADGAGFVTAYACSEGLPTDVHGGVSRSDLNYDAAVSRVASNRLVVQADDDGHVCVTPSTRVDLIVDVDTVSHVGITSFPNRRIDTRTGAVTTEPPGLGAVPTWPPFEPLPALDGVAALTGAPASAAVTNRPIVAVKIDNYRLARPQWGLDRADAVVELNVEGVTRFLALFHSRYPAGIGPVRSARTADIDLLAAMNRPVFAYSGANPGVAAWLTSAAGSGLLVDRRGQPAVCYARDPERPGPHDLSLVPQCVVDHATTAGAARPLWDIDPDWMPPPGFPTSATSQFAVPMDGVAVGWSWVASSGRYLRSQDGEPHVAASGERVAANNVVVLESHHLPSPVDGRSPHPGSVGAGAGVVHRDGVAIEVTWVRPTPYDPFTFVHPATGAPVPLDQGTTFVHLVRDR